MLSAKPVLSAFLTAFVIYISGCTKTDSPPSIIGTWVPGNITAITKTNGQTVQDTSYTATPSILGFVSLTFAASGNYTFVIYPTDSSAGGTYTYLFGTLTFTSGMYASGGQAVTLGANTLSYVSPDTLSMSPLSIKTITTTLNRQ